MFRVCMQLRRQIKAGDFKPSSVRYDRLIKALVVNFFSPDYIRGKKNSSDFEQELASEQLMISFSEAFLMLS